jgi:hypothetical protein
MNNAARRKPIDGVARYSRLLIFNTPPPLVLRKR